MSDDVPMGALSGTIAERSRAAIVAGCDVVPTATAISPRCARSPAKRRSLAATHCGAPMRRWPRVMRPMRSTPPPDARALPT